LIGWGLQRVTSLRPAVAAKVLLLWNALRGLIRYRCTDYSDTVRRTLQGHFT